MATATLTISDAQLTRVVAAVCVSNGLVALPPDLLVRVTADAKTSGVSVSDWLAAAAIKHLSRHPGRIRTEEM